MRIVMVNKSVGPLVALSLLVLCFTLPELMAAQSNSAAQEEVKVVARMELPRIHVNEMFVQHRDGKDYLYLHRPTRQAFAVVDVTKPEKPVLLERAALAESASARVDVVSSNPMLAIAVAQEQPAAVVPAKTASSADAPPAVAPLPTETVRLLDLSDPAHPRVLKTFAGVTSFLPDDSRKLIYIVNQEGLTIVRHRQSRPMPLCTSEDALMQAPNCQ